MINKYKILSDIYMNNALYVYDEINNRNIRMTSSDNELNVNNVEKTLKQYRREGKCYFTTVNGSTNAFSNDLQILWNPSDSSYRLGLYNVSISLMSDDITGSAANFRIVSISSADLKIDGTYIDARNIKLDEANDTDTDICTNKGTNGTVTENGVLDIVRFKPSSSAGKLFHKLDLQEEIVEIEPGNGVKFDLHLNNNNISFNYSVTFRYIKVSNEEEL